MSIQIKLLATAAKIPTKADEGAAGYDLYSSEEIIIPPLSRRLVKTDISMAIPQGFYGRIAPRSGLAFKYGIDVFAGVIDSSYRGSIGVILFNSDKEREFPVAIGDRIAQIIFESYADYQFEEVIELPSTDRGASGFGASGK